MAQQILDRLCDEMRDCETLAFADLSTGMVLLTNQATPESQDRLNALAQEAELTLGSDGGAAVVSANRKFHIFLRGQTVPNEGLFCICGPDADLFELLPAARACLEDLSGEGA